MTKLKIGAPIDGDLGTGIAELGPTESQTWHEIVNAPYKLMAMMVNSAFNIQVAKIVDKSLYSHLPEFCELLELGKYVLVAQMRFPPPQSNVYGTCFVNNYDNMENAMKDGTQLSSDFLELMTDESLTSDEQLIKVADLFKNKWQFKTFARQYYIDDPYDAWGN